MGSDELTPKDAAAAAGREKAIAEQIATEAERVRDAAAELQRLVREMRSYLIATGAPRNRAVAAPALSPTSSESGMARPLSCTAFSRLPEPASLTSREFRHCAMLAPCAIRVSSASSR